MITLQLKARRGLFKSSDNAGFTLIELLVVIAIIGMLASVILASLNTARLKARDARRLSDIKEIQTALALYFDDQSPVSYPTTSLSVLAPSYLQKIPTDPKTGSAYGYTGAQVTYVLGAQLENTSNSALSSGLSTGTAGTLNCATTGVYCVKP